MKKILMLLVTIMFAGNMIPGANAQQSDTSKEEGVWLKDPISGCAIWNSESKGNEAISWSGSCSEDGKASGNGVLVWLEDGKIVGRFTGAMANGKAEGKGKVYFKDEAGFAHYKGDFKNSEMHGRGVLVLANKSRVEGDFKNDQMNGYIKATLADGGSYEGEVKNNLPHGEGHQIKPEAEEYFGDFVDGNREGQGTLLLSNGDIYKGQFKNNLPEGTGSLRTVQGDHYEGPFKAGKPHGEGTYTATDGEVARGRVVMGEPDGKIIFTLKDGGTREENWKNGKKE
jgi:hypothetical protein